MTKQEDAQEDQAMIKRVQDGGYTFKPDFGRTGEATEANEMANKFSGGSDIKAVHLLVLLLRLRQICNHPGLIKSMLEDEEKANEGLEVNQSGDLADQLAGMTLGAATNKENADPEDQVKAMILDANNPVFKEKQASSKIITVLDELENLRKKFLSYIRIFQSNLRKAAFSKTNLQRIKFLS